MQAKRWERRRGRVAEFGRLYSLPSGRDLGRGARELLEKLAGLVPFDVGLAFLKEGETGHLVYLAGYPGEDEGFPVEDVPVPMQGGISPPRTLSAGEDEGLSSFLLHFVNRLGLRHFDFFDIPAGGRRTLYIVLGDRGEYRGSLRSPTTVGDAVRESLGRLIRGAAEEETRSGRHSRALMEVSRILAEETDPERLMERVLGIVERLVGARMAYLALLDPSDRSRLRGVAVKLGEELIELDTGMRNALYRKAREKGLDNLIAAMEECLTPGLVREGAVILEVPVRLEGELLGMIKCALREPHVDETDLEFLQALAAQLAAGIKISDHYRKLREREKGLSALNALLSDLSECLFREEMADYLARTLPSMVGGTEALLLLWSREGDARPSVLARWGEGKERGTNPAALPFLERVLGEARLRTSNGEKWALFRRLDLVGICGGPEALEEAGVEEAFLFPASSSMDGEWWCVVLSSREEGLDGDFLFSIADSLVGAVQSSFLRAAFYEEALREEGKLTAVFDAMQDAVLVFDGEGKLIAANRVADRLFDFRKRGVIGRGLEEEDLHPSLYRFVRESSGEGGNVVSEEMMVPMEPPRYVRAYKSKVRLPAGEAAGEVVVVRDVTEEKEVEFLKDDFLACVSHELRTPLSIVLGYLEVLCENWERLDELTRRDSLWHTRRAAEKLKGVIVDILDTAKASRRELVLRKAPVELDLVAEEVTRQARVADGDHAYRFVRMPGSCACLADETKMRRVLWNLLDNARKFSPPGTEVTVTVGRRSDGVFLSVEDRGIGISQWHLPLIFRRFAQVDRGDARRSQGLGIGLFLVAEIVELHRGKVEVRSEPGRGSTFTVLLPPAEAVSAEGEANAGSDMEEITSKVMGLVEAQEQRDTGRA